MKKYVTIMAAPACAKTIVDTCSLPKATTDANNGATQIDIMLNIVFAFSASIAVLIIIVCGFRYIVAHGDPNATAQAKNGILYALVGLFIVMAAYSIVTFVVRGLK